MYSSAQKNQALSGQCLIIGHRGAPAYGGENTLFGFRNAINLGADGFELDLIQTKDGLLIVGHDYKLNRLIGEAQLETLFPERKKEKNWVVTDFDQEELRNLKVTFPAPDSERPDYQIMTSEYRMPTLGEALNLLLELRQEHERNDLKIYIEIKTDDKYSHTMTLNDISDQVKNELKSRNLLKDSNVWIQSFDPRMMDVVASDKEFYSINKCQLGFDDTQELSKFTKKRNAKKYLKKVILERNLQMFHVSKVPTKLIIEQRNIPLIELAHKKNIPIHLYTFRDPNYAIDYKFLSKEGVVGFETVEEELAYFIELGVDAIMSDNILSAIKIRDKIYDQTIRK